MKIELNFKFWVEVLGDVAVFGMLLLPAIFTFPKIKREQDVGSLLCFPFASTWLNAVAFVFYGAKRQDWLVVGINGVAFIVESVYCGIYIWYSTSWKRILAWVMVVVQICFFAGMLTMQLAIFNHHQNPDTRDRVYCITGAVTTAAMYLSTFHQAIFAFSTHDVAGLELGTGFLTNAAIWTLYSALNPMDLYLLIANGMGIVFTGFQVGVWLAFRNHQPQAPPATSRKRGFNTGSRGPLILVVQSELPNRY